MQAEILALLYQLIILQRSNRHRLRLTTGDPLFWVWLSRPSPDWRSTLLIVRPETFPTKNSVGVLAIAHSEFGR